VEVTDAEEARLGRLFNTLMVVTIAFMLTLSAILTAMGPLGLLSTSGTLRRAAFSLVVIPFAIFCLIQTRRGRVRAMSKLYVWGTFGFIALACALFNGSASPAFILFLWVVAVAGVLLAPYYALLLSGVVLLYYGVLWFAERQGFYTPLLPTDETAYRFMNQSFTFLILIFVAGLITYLNMRSLRQTLANLRGTTDELEKSRRLLETRVTERTEQLQQRSEQSQAIAEFTRSLAGLRDLGRLLDSAVILIAERLHYYDVAIFLLNDSEEWVLLKAASSAGGKRMVERGYRLRVGSPEIIGQTAATARPQVAVNEGDAALNFQLPELPAAQSELALPLLSGGRLLGVLDIRCDQIVHFAGEDIQILDILAGSLAAMITNTRLLQETQQALERLEHYQEEEVIQGWYRALARRNKRLGYSYDRITVRPELPDAALMPVDLQNLTGLQVLESEGQYLLLAPLRVQQRTLGALSFRASRPWTEEEQRLVGSVVTQLGLALENARLLEDTRLSAQQEKARSEIVGRVRSSMQVDTVLRSATEELGRALGVERVRIQLLPPGRPVDSEEASVSPASPGESG
jgi:GAF domain-containing protein